jgi:quercetin 2,3-dioxygenase
VNNLHTMSNNRRSFFKKLGAGVISTAGLSSMNKKSNQMSEEKIILDIKPMGFIWDTLDPFLFCVHHEDKFPKGNENMGPDASHFQGRSIGDDFIIKDGFRMYHGSTVPGFPGHPHRGFETITVVREGMVDHSDSLGASGRYGEGDVQWMTAGKGVQHAEMFPLIHADKENPLELFQIWLNLPAKSKMVEPHFAMLWGSKIPRYIYKDSNGNETNIEVMAGSLHGHTAPPPPPDSWAADPLNEVAVFNMQLEPNAKVTIPSSKTNVNRVVYFYEGEDISIGEQTIAKYHSIVVNGSIDLVIENGAKDAKILLLQGKPINETVIQYGPFVMNSKAEINQAFEDYHATKFGGWPWDKYDHVHPKEEGRFAKHADGTYEKGV